MKTKRLLSIKNLMGGGLLGLLLFISHPTYAADSSIGLAITPTNLAITAPASGGLVAGKQSIKLTSNSNYQTNYNLSLSSKDINTSLLPTKTGNTTKLLTTTGTLTKPATALNNNEWGISLDGKSYIGLPSVDSNPLQLMNGTLNNSSNNSNTANTTATKDIAFATKTTEVTPADTYTINLVYTLTAEEILPAPTITGTDKVTYQIGDETSTTWRGYGLNGNGSSYTNQSYKARELTITGTNFIAGSTIAYIDFNNNNQLDNNESCTDVAISNNGATLTCTLPSNNAISDGIYSIVVANNNQAATKQKAISYVTSSICENANPNSDCQVDIDANMIPVKYTGNTTNPEWTIVTQNELDNDPGSWYNYENKQWANAVTMNPAYLANYKNSPAGTVIPEDAILSYFTYIPRYAYEVMRPNATDKFVYDQNFAIKFEKATDTKKYPASSLTCNPYNNKSTAEEIANTKDYRTECNIDRIYPTTTAKANQTTWATHPAFTKGATADSNGIWVGKYEVSGSNAAPTIKPNKYAITAVRVGSLYDISKSMGVRDASATGGNNTTGLIQNNNNLASQHASMMTNTIWGSVAYLSASKYGVGVNGVQINSQWQTHTDGNGVANHYGVTGCGPVAIGNTSTYTDGSGVEGQATTCSTDASRSYNGTLGMTNSSTGNPTGLYGLSGGANDYVLGSRSATNAATSTTIAGLNNPIPAKFADLYSTSDDFGTKPAWSKSSSEYYYNNDNCTWSTCAGQALNETKLRQTVSSLGQSWGGDSSSFPSSSRPWSVRGGSPNYGGGAGVFSLDDSGAVYVWDGFRPYLYN